MFIKSFIILLFSFLSIGRCVSAALAQDIDRIEAFKKNDRVLILVPHPDDETIACAGVIKQAQKAGSKVRVVYLTNGDHNQFAFIVYEKRLTFRRTEFIHMGLVRRQEAIEAMRLLGLGADKLTFLGYPDNGIFAIFSRYWQTQKPFRSLLTRISSVPYKTDLSFGSPYVGESILSDLEKAILNYKPTKIFVSHPADVNADHKALYLFLQIALRELRNRIPQVKVYPYLIHSLDWPKPRDYHPELNLKPPEGLQNAQIEWSKLDLNPVALWLKYKAVLSYKSQTEVSAFYLLSFARKNELFGDYPEIQLKKQVSLKKQPPAGNHGEVSYTVVDKCLIIRVAKDKELIHRFSVVLYIFGFSNKKPFAAMPKIHIKARHEKFVVYDGTREIDPKNIRLNLNPDDLILRIPLEVLGNPDFMLTSVRAYGGKPALSDTGFRRIIIK